MVYNRQSIASCSSIPTIDTMVVGTESFCQGQCGGDGSVLFIEAYLYCSQTSIILSL